MLVADNLYPKFCWFCASFIWKHIWFLSGETKMKQEDSEDLFRFQTIIEVWVFIRSAKLRNIPKQLNSKHY